MNEHERAAHLGRAWDTFKRTDVLGCNPDDLAVVRSLIAFDRQPAPDSRFVARLEGALTGPGTAPRLPVLHWPSAQVAGSSVDSGDVLSLPEWSRRPTVARWAAGGIAILVCGALAFLALLGGSNDDDTPTSLPAYGDAATATLFWQETSTCDVPARSGGSFRALLGLSASYPQPGPPPLDEIGVPADGVTTAQLEATMREILACRTVAQHRKRVRAVLGRSAPASKLARAGPGLSGSGDVIVVGGVRREYGWHACASAE